MVTFFLIFFIGLGIIIFTPFANWLAQFFYVKPKLKKAQTIVALSGGVYPDGNLGFLTLERVVYAIELYQKSYGSKIIFSGGTTHDGLRTDAELMAKLAFSLGVPQEDILIEGKSKNTFENIVNSFKLMQEKHLNSALLITSSFHMRRAFKVAERNAQGIFYPASVPSSDAFRRCPADRFFLFYNELREIIAFIFFKIKGWI